MRDVRALKVARDIFLFFGFLFLLGVLGLVGFGWVGCDDVSLSCVCVVMSLDL